MRAFVVLAVLLVAGCGGGEKEPPPPVTQASTTSTMSPPRFSTTCRSAFDVAKARPSDPIRFVASVQVCDSVAEWMAAGADAGTVRSANFEESLRILDLSCKLAADPVIQRRSICVEADDLVH